MKKTIKLNLIVNLIIILGVISLFLEDLIYKYKFVFYLNNALDYIIYILYFISTVVNLINNFKNRKNLIWNIIEISVILIFSALFFYTKFYLPLSQTDIPQHLYTRAVLIRNIFLFFKIFLRINKVNLFLKKFSANPAISIVFSFLIVILLGTILLMMPVSTSDQTRIGFINALFTATSAVCVTGLIVVDTAVKFSLFGKIVIMLLIQIGGLGIMILSFFTAFVIGKKITLEEKMTLTYLINENDTKKVSSQIKRIIYITLLVEFFGACFLFLRLNKSFDNPLTSVFYSVFHSISAFCNAGFSLYTDSLEQFKSDTSINLIICLLIITGSISFGVLINTYQFLKTQIKKYWLKKETLQSNLSLNTKVVLITTVILITAGMLIIFQFEHWNLIDLDLKTQFLTAFFQSVTLRTAGFNTINFNNLNNYTYLIMIIFMFIGGASGSTAGGIKVNTLGIIYAYTKSLLKGEKKTILMKKSISVRLINNSFLIIILYLILVFFGTLLISIFENQEFIKILFEVVSAIGTVGLSAGLTFALSEYSKVIIIILMFFGRIGPMTILNAVSYKSLSHEINYPEDNISIG